jgi:hypothetical protein
MSGTICSTSLAKASLLILLLLFSFGPSTTVLAQGDERRISAFVMGQVVHAPYVPFTVLFMQDPLFTYALYPLSTQLNEEEKSRLDKVYYPRTGKMLTEAYDVIIYRDARFDHFTPRQYHDLDYAFREEGLVSVTVHSLSWGIVQSSIIYDTTPISEYEYRMQGSWRVRLSRERDPIFIPFVDLGIEKVTGAEYGIMTPKPGATVWGELVPQGYPWLVSWKPGGGNAGMQWVFGDKFDSNWWGTVPAYRSSNLYGIDLATNLLLYSLDRPIIADILARKEARNVLQIFRSRELLVLSMLDWAERFGANGDPISRGLEDLEEEAEKAVDRYLDQEYVAAITFMNDLDPRIAEMSEQARRLKDQALFWVYIIEWMSVTGVSMAAGVTLWSLMVRRRMYRPVGQTRMRISRRD